MLCCNWWLFAAVYKLRRRLLWRIQSFCNYHPVATTRRGSGMSQAIRTCATAATIAATTTATTTGIMALVPNSLLRHRHSLQRFLVPCHQEGGLKSWIARGKRLRSSFSWKLVLAEQQEQDQQQRDILPVDSGHGVALP
jgi:hypothetical protein